VDQVDGAMLMLSESWQKNGCIRIRGRILMVGGKVDLTACTAKKGNQKKKKS